MTVSLLRIFSTAASARWLFANLAMSSSSSSGAGCVPNQERLLRLSAVSGSQPRRLNDVLLLRPDDRERRHNAHVVFFPGDIQNFHQDMTLHPEVSPWILYSLEQVATVLGERFPGHHIWLVRPSQTYLHKFSCYANFVESDSFGAPRHSQDYGAVSHLRALLANAMMRAGISEHFSTQRDASDPSSLPTDFYFILVAFSKGCVVLNQIVHELETARSNPELRPFLDSISDMYWLDGGHPGAGQTWVTDKRALGELASTGVAIHAHVTPYQVCDPVRTWVGREHQLFVKILQELGACVTQKLHFDNEPACITNHFRVIKEF